ncbi:MAG TPA: divalent metal cation transporter, partial [Bacteroidales bacterium]|nr:divalent metal cation transporter [Bacteroidales bacterium]
RMASHVFAFGLFVASVFSATILPLATAFYVCEAFGFEAGIDKSLDEAREFYFLYTGILVLCRHNTYPQCSPDQHLNMVAGS